MTIIAYLCNFLNGMVRSTGGSDNDTFEMTENCVVYFDCEGYTLSLALTAFTSHISNEKMLQLFTWGILVLDVCAEQVILQQPHISPPKNSHFRDIVWGDLNFIHTTDTHGWLAGHLNQKQYSADWGDFISFTSHLHDIADDAGVDLLLVDTGDKHDGNGLSDATTPNGAISSTIFNKQDYDLLTLGNHELYYADYSIQEYETTVKQFGDKYVSSNVEYLTDDGDWIAFGNKYRYFETKNQRKKILALSFLFDFKRYNPRSRVTPIKESIRQDWFKNLTSEITEDNIDLLIVYGHLPVTDIENHEINRLHLELRRLYPTTIIQYFGGHSHIRDFVRLDYRSTGIQSGRYCETAGWLSINTTQAKFNRRYIDFNRESFIHHTNTTKKSFDTEEGVSISKSIKNARRKLDLTYSHGYVPETFLMNGHPLGHKNNIYTLLNSTILPTLENTINRGDHNRIILINSGSVRYDLYRGNFTKDTEFIVSPFKNDWAYITIPKDLALKVGSYLNKGDFISSLAAPETKGMLTIKRREEKIGTLNNAMEYRQCPFVREPGLKSGLTTSDDFGCDGDDVLHNSVPYYPPPNIVETVQITNKREQQVDLVFYDFIQPYIIDALNTLSETRNFSQEEVHHYGGESTGALLREYVRANWA